MVAGFMLVAAAAFLGGCQGQQISDADIQVMREEQMADALEAPDTVVVDVRKPERYAEGHLPGAINIYLPEIQRNDARLAEAERIVVYGKGWRDPLSTAAAKKMMALGYANVHEFKCGIEVWENADRRLVESSETRKMRPETGPTESAQDSGNSEDADGGGNAGNDRDG
jgi:rhodanese-related sulfurtransferase